MPQLLPPHKNDWSLHSSAKKDLLLQVQYTTVVILDEMYLSRNSNEGPQVKGRGIPRVNLHRFFGQSFASPQKKYFAGPFFGFLIEK